MDFSIARTQLNRVMQRTQPSSVSAGPAKQPAGGVPATAAEKIAFIGCGNMGMSLIGGLIAAGYPAAALSGVQSSKEQRRKVETRFGIRVSAELAEGIAGAAALILAVKPHIVPAVLDDVLAAVKSSRKTEVPLVISVAAGLRVAAIAKRLDGLCPVVRAMPSTPALVGAGATALYVDPDAARRVTAAQRRLATRLMQAFGVAVWLDDESLMDAVTAVSSTGPAYFFLVVELLENIAVDMGLEREQARLLIVQAALGAGRMLKETGADAAALRKQMTTPAGATEQAMQVFQDGGLEPLFRRALSACRARSVELAGAGE